MALTVRSREVYISNYTYWLIFAKGNNGRINTKSIKIVTKWGSKKQSEGHRNIIYIEFILWHSFDFGIL